MEKSDSITQSPNGNLMSLFDGHVMHSRLRPFRHKFRYHVFSVGLDIDRLYEIETRFRFFSWNSFNIFSFHDRDHGYRDGSYLRTWVERQLRSEGVPERPATIELICFPRILGYVFNPLSLFFCKDSEGRVFAVIYEVRNTFGEKHPYVVRVDRNSEMHKHSREKSFYVSPFYDVAGDYRFRISLNDRNYALRILHGDEDGPLMIANHVADRHEASDLALLKMLLRIPLMPIKVIGGIHLEALKLWIKGAKYRPHTNSTDPAGPDEPMTVR